MGWGRYYLAYGSLLLPAPIFLFLSLNHHWTPRGVTLFLVVGGVASLLAGAYRVGEVRGYRLAWLVVLGRTALVLYFVHQVMRHCSAS